LKTSGERCGWIWGKEPNLQGKIEMEEVMGRWSQKRDRIEKENNGPGDYSGLHE